MMTLCFDVLTRLEGKSLATAESCTGGAIGAALTAVPGASSVYKGGIISYCDAVKHKLLKVDEAVLAQYGAVSAHVAQAMAAGARAALETDISISITGLAGPGGDEFGNPVGTVFIGYSDRNVTFSRKYDFEGDREEVRNQAACAALALVLELNPE